MSAGNLPRTEANVLRGHEGAVLAARFNANGEYCLSCGKDRTIRLWNPHRGLHIKTYKSHGREVRDVHVTLDNSKLCSCGGDRQVFYWDVATGRVIRKFRGHDSEVCTVGGIDFVKLHEIGVGNEWLERCDISLIYASVVHQLAMTAQSVLVLTALSLFREISDDLGQPVNCISLSNDGNCVLASCLDSTLRLLDRSTGELLQEYKGHTCKLMLPSASVFKMDCCLTNTDAHVAGGSEDGYVYFWDLVDANVVSSFRAHSSVVTSVSYHPKDDCMISASVDGTIRVWKA
ncbi:WD repeat domain-containing protein 83 [Sesamum angolense]|uniref:WD repeat domain-containing protein 83 n=1 Tax=Sesamum angolense TaxID=2727404 RepID=A0AAE1XGS4_9LAMI|nr:WD repeat domain-containing protein 83 [Sesamum angolense]